MKNHSKSIIALAGVLGALSLGTAHAESGTTNIISGTVVDNAGTNYYVGNTGLENFLEINSGGQFINCAQVGIGWNTGANSNNAVVTDSGSLWQATNSFYLGNSGAYNSLTISNGGTLNNANTAVIGGNSTGSNNTALITGNGSVWNASGSGGFYLGNSSAGNSLTISDGGVLSSAGYAFIGVNTNAGNNTALVTGSGSQWQCSQQFNLGWRGVGNSLTISNGGALNTGGGLYLGYNASASNNTALVTDNNSVVQVGGSGTGSIYLGNNGPGNSLTISNGGTVLAGTIRFGVNASASNNTAMVTGAGSLWNCGAFFMGFAGGSGSNSLTIANGGQVLLNRGTYNDFYIGYTNGNNSALVTGAGSALQSIAGGYIGTWGSSGNSLTIANGGAVNNLGLAFIGYGAGSSSNTVNITGAGSAWNTYGQDFTVGNNAAATNNVLHLGNGGLLAAGHLIVGNGVNGLVNLGDGTALATANVRYLQIQNGSGRVNINAGVIKATGNTSYLITGWSSYFVRSGGVVIDDSGYTVAGTATFSQDGTSPGGGLTKIGIGTYTITGANSYTGNTTVSQGTLALSGTGSISTSALISVTNGATFDVSGLSSSFTINAGRTLSNNAASTGLLKGNLNSGSGTVSVSYTNGTPAFALASGTLTLTNLTTFNIDNTGSPLAVGNYLIISTNAGGSVACPGALPGVNVLGSGTVAGTKSLSITNGELYLVVQNSAPPSPVILTNSVISGNQLVLSWPAGWLLQSQTNPLSTGLSTNWVTITGATSPFTNAISSTNGAVFYRLVY